MDTWVVYKMALDDHPSGVSAVCEQCEWEAMERNQPGRQILVQGGLASEAEAERLARGTLGDRYNQGAGKRLNPRRPRPEPAIL